VVSNEGKKSRSLLTIKKKKDEKERRGRNDVLARTVQVIHEKEEEGEGIIQELK